MAYLYECIKGWEGCPCLENKLKPLGLVISRTFDPYCDNSLYAPETLGSIQAFFVDYTEWMEQLNRDF